MRLVLKGIGIGRAWEGYPLWWIERMVVVSPFGLLGVDVDGSFFNIFINGWMDVYPVNDIDCRFWRRRCVPQSMKEAYLEEVVGLWLWLWFLCYSSQARKWSKLKISKSVPNCRSLFSIPSSSQ